MRIISGKYKGRRLLAPKNLPVRPTTDMAKESLFNILNNHFFLDEIVVLDLFSGTGNISFEFASRGAKKIVAVDGHAGCVRYIHNTAKSLEFDISAVKMDVFKYLGKNSEQFDVIFADPPYEMGIEDLSRIREMVFVQGMLNQNGLLVLEHASQTDLSALPHFMEARKYGSTVFSFFSETLEEA